MEILIAKVIIFAIIGAVCFSWMRDKTIDNGPRSIESPTKEPSKDAIHSFMRFLDDRE